MTRKQINIFTLLVGVTILVWLSKDMLSQPGVDQLKGGFVEKASYRNDNNTGPIQHVFVVEVKDSTVAQLETYGELMPHHKYGNTKVYFFKYGSKTPDRLYPGNENFDARYNENCFAVYEKNAAGISGVLRNPFY